MIYVYVISVHVKDTEKINVDMPFYKNMLKIQNISKIKIINLIIENYYLHFLNYYNNYTKLYCLLCTKSNSTEILILTDKFELKILVK